jgi:hypothetical protein
MDKALETLPVSGLYAELEKPLGTLPVIGLNAEMDITLQMLPNNWTECRDEHGS